MSLVNIVFLALLCTILQQKCATCQSCTPTDYPPFMDRHLEPNGQPLQVPHPLRFLIMSYLFGCVGNITKWELYTVNSGSHPIEFQVWREDTRISRTLTFNLVGSNYFPDARPDTNNLLSLPVPQEQQIRVQPGDILGITTLENNSTNDFRIQDFIFQGTVVLHSYVTSAENGDGAAVPELESLLFSSVNARFSIIHFLPVMNVTVVPTQADTADEERSGPTPLPQSTVIVIASAGALLVMLSLVLFITLILCCCVMVKRVKGSTAETLKPHHVTAQEPETVELDYNPAYLDGSGEVNYEHETQTEPYYSLVTEEQGGVSDTRDSYVEIQPNHAPYTK